MPISASELSLAVRTRRRDLDRRDGEARSVANRLRSVLGEIESLTEDAEVNAQVAAVLNSIGEQRQEDAQRVIESLITQGLHTIFGPELSFHLATTTKASKTNVEFMVKTTLDDGTEVMTSVMDARGGGVASVIGFLMRVVMLLLGSGGEDVMLLCDETFSMVSAEYLDGVAGFVSDLVAKTGIQIILVTHQPEFLDYADKAYRFSTDRTGSTVVRDGSTHS